MPDDLNIEGVQRTTFLLGAKPMQMLTYPLAILHQ